MSKIPSLKPRQVIAALLKAGFLQRGTTGSHMIFRHSVSGKIAVLPIHGGRDVKKGTLRNIIRQSGLSVEEFLELL